MDQLIIHQGSAREVLEAANFPQLEEEYAEEGAIEGLPKPRAKFELYLHLEAVGALRTFVAKLQPANQLIGFITLLVTEFPHYSEPLAVCESFFVFKQSRKSGAGLKLLRAAEQHALASKAKGLLVSAPVAGVLAQVMPRVGYRLTNLAFFKALGEAAGK